MVEVHDILERNSIIIYDEYAPLRTFLRDPVDWQWSTAMRAHMLPS